ncbi:MAG: LysR family transcriptional regulator [gamma proteobacterium symbiont of Bathyaustriella thionipta]|nr:LysR family transcriptional regulator [gamma proteobacterium symbiont of Bathyaustriella thionipta]MCU7950623.1 LysR family transcriptional regulator [gamma proteobacterium symbiont of Bathyaustriella thionipta]MCU7954763.1 LysR family transcriptional regulator [gamma proteobacterium symbiont of Bathyaustriella thionipta]MCU7957122.1 LysR family transcriptional regulator [gamma proteobacterium symbiont of Bathyaustriella thionipta]MCU7967921.1 LysR family transcriptional regulator [gamma pro
MNRFENMENFIRVVEVGSISGAADRLGVAKSAVSRRLKELEEHLGVELFHRTTRRMNLTDTGRAFYHQCVRILEDTLEAELASAQVHGTLKGGLKIALPSTFGLMHMGPAINEFLQAHPQIEFDLDFNDREVDLMQEGFDLAIRIARLPDSSLIARRLAPIQSIMCASPSYLKKMGTPKTPDELLTHQCLVYSLLHDYEYWHLTDAEGKEFKTKIRPYLKATTGEFIRDAAVADQGIILVPSFIVYKEIERGELIPVLKEYKPLQIDAYAIYPQTRHLSQRVRTFVDFLVKRFEGTPYWDLQIQKLT